MQPIPKIGPQQYFAYPKTPPNRGPKQTTYFASWTNGHAKMRSLGMTTQMK